MAQTPVFVTNAEDTGLPLKDRYARDIRIALLVYQEGAALAREFGGVLLKGGTTTCRSEPLRY
jgi:hypothetical protein